MMIHAYQLPPVIGILGLLWLGAYHMGRERGRREACEELAQALLRKKLEEGK